jgi:cytidine deaminase
MKLTKPIIRLIETAITAQKGAYCPYSRYRVGAAVLTETGRIFSGGNVENASYGLSICAERVAIANAVTRGHRALKALCVVASAAKPCGACRQVMIEFSGKDTELYLVDLNPTTGRRLITKTTVLRMLPAAFDPIASGLLPPNPQNLLRTKHAHRRKTRRRKPASRRTRPQ